MPDQREIKSPWTSQEIVIIDRAGRQSFPYWNALMTGGRIDAQPIIRMQKVQEVGWPDAAQVLFFSVGTRRKKRIVKKDDVIWELKCTPNCWRLYFYVSEQPKHIVYVHAVCKKTDAEDPRDAASARQQYDCVSAGRCTTRPFRFPNG